VTIKPPTTLTEAKIKAKNPKMVVRTECCSQAERRAPTMVMPEMALDPDIRGVCRVGGIFVMISNPTKIANTKMVNPMMNISITLSLFFC
jgi:hypothetical protein